MFSERLKKLRKEKGLTQSQLAEELNIARTSNSNYELGTRTPDIDVLITIADYFKVTTDYLTGKSEDMNNPSQPDDFKIVEILRQHVGMLAEKSKNCELDDLRKNSMIIVQIFDRIKNY